MSSRCRSSLVLTISFLLLVTGLEATTDAKSLPDRRTQRSVKRKPSAKSSSRRAGKGGRRSRYRATGRGRRGRYARARGRRRADVASDSVSVARQSGSGIPTERVTEIQSALIKFGYLEGPPSGEYNEATVAAMKQFQNDSRLPATGLPSAHALKRLGVSKRSNDGYAIPVTKGSRSDKTQGPSPSQ
jgi:Putative peptidoglycan binding domain